MGGRLHLWIAGLAKDGESLPVPRDGLPRLSRLAGQRAEPVESGPLAPAVAGPAPERQRLLEEALRRRGVPLQEEGPPQLHGRDRGAVVSIGSAVGRQRLLQCLPG